MQGNKNVREKLVAYGLNLEQQNKKSIQQKIIQMYELLEQNTTQNLLLRKDNDDLKLQIQTIKELFMNSEIDINSYSKSKSLKQIKKINSHQSQQQNSEKKNDRIDQIVHRNNATNAYNNYRCNSSIKNQPEEYCHQQYQNQKNVDEEANQNLSFQEQTYIQKNKHPKSHFYKQDSCEQQNHEETRRKFHTKKQKSCLQQKSINQKIELLVKQNEIILKRMNQIESNLINCQRDNSYANGKKKNFDDKETNFSSNITSIQNIWGRKQSCNQNKSKLGRHRNHRSTNNLRTYSNCDR